MLDIDKLTKYGAFFLWIISLMNEMKVGVKCKSELWKSVFESKGFRLNRTKTEYVEWSFSKVRNIHEGLVKIEGTA